MQSELNRTFVLIGRSLKISVGALPTLAIITYFSGWQYANEYFSQFGINRSNIAFNDNTVFTQSFSVVANIWGLLMDWDASRLLWVIPFFLVVIGPKMFKLISKKIPRLTGLRSWAWIWLMIGLFNVSQQAGAYDADLVKSGCARKVKPIFTRNFNKDLATPETEVIMEALTSGLVRASSNNAIALIWRSQSETFFLRFSDSLPDEIEPIQVVRVNNNIISVILSKIEKDQGEGCNQPNKP